MICFFSFKFILINTDKKYCYLCIGQHVEGIWHTAIVAYGREYFFGPSGIQSARPVSISKIILRKVKWSD